MTGIVAKTALSTATYDRLAVNHPTGHGTLPALPRLPGPAPTAKGPSKTRDNAHSKVLYPLLNHVRLAGWATSPTPGVPFQQTLPLQKVADPMGNVMRQIGRCLDPTKPG